MLASAAQDAFLMLLRFLLRAFLDKPAKISSAGSVSFCELFSDAS